MAYDAYTKSGDNGKFSRGIVSEIQKTTEAIGNPVSKDTISKVLQEASEYLNIIQKNN